jgi:hypothetical protein
VPIYVTINTLGEGSRGYALDPNNAEALWNNAKNWLASPLGFTDDSNLSVQF